MEPVLLSFCSAQNTPESGQVCLADLNLEAREEKGREWQLAQVSDKSGHASCPSKRIRLACGWCGLTGRVSAGCGLVRVEASDL